MEEQKSKHRVFVHDIANDLTIADGALTKALFLLEKKGVSPEEEEVVKLNKAKQRIKDMVTKLKEYRAYIHSQESGES